MTTTTTWPNLPNSPIVEGLIDFQVEPSASGTIAALKAACEELAAEFPSKQDMHRFFAHVNFSTEPNASTLTTDKTSGGIRLRSADEKWAADFRLNGFMVSRLQPYGTWDELKSKASALWAKYAEVAQPTKVVRVATRFINRVPITVGEPIDKTFLTNFVVGPTLPQAVAGYLLRIVVQFEEYNSMAIVTQSFEVNSTDCILDIDVFSEQPTGFAENEVWNKLDELRDAKNRLFFGSLTEAALERFK